MQRERRSVRLRHAGGDDAEIRKTTLGLGGSPGGGTGYWAGTLARPAESRCNRGTGTGSRRRRLGGLCENPQNNPRAGASSGCRRTIWCHFPSRARAGEAAALPDVAALIETGRSQNRRNNPMQGDVQRNRRAPVQAPVDNCSSTLWITPLRPRVRAQPSRKMSASVLSDTRIEAAKSAPHAPDPHLDTATCCARDTRFRIHTHIA